MKWHLVLLIVLALIAPTDAQNDPQATSGSWRPTIVAQHGMVAAGHPLAAEAGLRILKAGGNAMDAAIATWAVQGEVEPGMTGLGADMFVLYYEAKTGKVHFINGTGYAPQAATIEFYTARGGIPDEGPLSSAVPGAVGGAAYAVKTYGTKKLAEVLAPAIEIADEGFPVSEGLASTISSARAKIAKFPSTTKIYFKDGKPLQLGDIIRNPDLGRTLRAIAAQGADTFYKRNTAKTPAAFLTATVGTTAPADLPAYQPFEDAPIHVNYRGVEV